MKRFYNIHDILKLEVNSGVSSLNDLDREFAFFKCERVNDPDIILNIGNFKPSTSDCYVVDHKYYVRDNYIYYLDSEGKAKWSVEIFGFEDGRTTINFYSSVKGIQRLLNPNFLAKDILLRTIEYKLGRMEYYLVHSAGVSRNGTAYLLAGRGGSLKTTLTMDLIRKGGFHLLGDDHVILNGENVLSFPENLQIFGYMIKNLETEVSWNFIDKIKFAYKLMRGCKYNNLKINNLSEIGAVLFILRKNGHNICIRELDRREATDRLIANNMVDDFISPQKLDISTGIYLKCMLAYSYVFPHSEVAKFYDSVREGLKDILRSVLVYEVEIPSKYSISTFERIKSFIDSLEKEVA